LPALMRQEQFSFLRQVLAKTFDFSPISKEIEWFRKNHEEDFIASEMKPVPVQILERLEAERTNTEKFVHQLASLWNENNLDKILERVEKGVGYYKTHVTNLLKLLLTHIREMQQHKRVKTYLTHLTELDQLLSKKLEEFEKALFLVNAIIHQKNDYDFSERQQQLHAARASLIKEINASELKASAPKRKTKSKKNGDGKSTYDITLELFGDGKTVSEIAKIRELTPQTIEGHLAVAVGQRKLSIFKFMSEETVGEITEAIKSLPENHTSKDLFEKLRGKYSYGQLKAVNVHSNLYKPFE
jgi:Helix-turn-helix domain